MPEQHLLLAEAGTRDLTQLGDYQKAGGYKALARARTRKPAPPQDFRNRLYTPQKFREKQMLRDHALAGE